MGRNRAGREGSARLARESGMNTGYYKIEVKLQQRDQAITLAKAIDALMVKNGIAGEAELATVRDVLEVDLTPTR
jgi:predicted component of type VI protein secretion system